MAQLRPPPHVTVEQLFTLDPVRAHIPRGVAQDWPQAGQRGVMIDAGPQVPPYRWLRYVSPNGGHGNVAEVEFYTSPARDASIALNAPTGLRALGTNTVNATVTNLTARTVTHATVAVTINPVDGGAPLTVRFTGVALDPGRTVASVTLPQSGSGRAALHIFAIGVN